MGNIDLSVIAPLYNEEDNVELLYQAIKSAVQPLGLEYEILFVDDGSSDGTVAKAKKLADQDSRLRVIKFRRNYGQTPAMAAGIDHARGETLITMDGDLQNDPRDIPLFLEKIHEGYDIVVGWRHKRQDKLITRKIPSRIANWLIGKITGVPIKDNGCSLKAYKANVIKPIPLYSEMHRFIPAMSSLAGTKVAEIRVRHHARKYGVSKYGLSRIYKVIIDLIAIKTLLSFFSKPIRFFAMGSFIALLIGFLTLISWLFAGSEQPAFVLFSIAFIYIILGISLMFWGLLGELIYRTGNLKLDYFANISSLQIQIKDS